MLIKGYECVIGIEIHAQLQTKSKMFCSCPNHFDAADNENTCPVCMGMPGALPVLNDKALDFAIRTGLALNCQINHKSVFARKNYFYPDLPKGYQISQYELPICGNGEVEIILDDGSKKKIRIERAHLEEDAGKSSHHGNHSLVNYNRSSVPLLEIVSGPDMHSPAEAASYVRSMRSILQFIEICDGNLEEGSMRADCNISIRKSGEKALNTRVELKNLNSFRFIEKALQYEFERQVDSVLSGETVVQETRLYDKDKNKTYSMRSKEDAQDYRYFPDPDLQAAVITDARIEKVKSALPELPLARVNRFMSEYQIPEYDAHVLTQTKPMANYFEVVAKNSKSPKLASNWIMGELLRVLNEEKLEIENSKITAEHLAKLIVLIENGTISGKIAKTVFEEMWKSPEDPEKIVKAKGLVQVSDEGAIEKIVEQVMAANPAQLQDYRNGKDKLFGFFVGQSMKASKGQANPEVLNKILLQKLKA
ncbi:MAG: Asp-tRNA(Asn)/Glu-tRNA(Gln) amidotransferase subunit GatB [Bdellovibrionales bacterium]|nr:Asp-tRNA(Asn)/Glu-tRNA(Gln) amidotransferase subunit GatB [Bdellovibrionales bacterium]